MNKIFKKIKKEEGFTLLEMSIVLLIIAALLLLIIPNVGDVNNRTEQTTEKAAISTVEAQILLYKMDYPENEETGDALLTSMKEKDYITEEQFKAYTKAEIVAP